MLGGKSIFETGQFSSQLHTSEESGSILKTWMLLTSVRIIFVPILLRLLIYTNCSCSVKFDSFLNVLHSLDFECVKKSSIWLAAGMSITISITALNFLDNVETTT